MGSGGRHARLIGEIFHSLGGKWLAGAFAGIGSLFGAIYGWAFSPEQQADARAVIEAALPFWPVLPLLALSAVAVVTYRKLLPSCRIEFDTSDYFQAMEFSFSSSQNIRKYRVAIYNSGSVELTNCIVQLTDLVDWNGNRPLSCPILLERAEGQGPFNLRPGHRKFAIVVSMDELRYDDDTVFLIHATHEVSNQHKPFTLPIMTGTYVATIGVFPANSRPDTRRFRLRVDKRNKLRMEPVELVRHLEFDELVEAQIT